jgi:hypothetical protein
MKPLLTLLDIILEVMYLVPYYTLNKYVKYKSIKLVYDR